LSAGGTNPASLKGKLMTLEVKFLIQGNDKSCSGRNEFPQKRSCGP